MKYYVQVQGLNGAVQPCVVTAADGDEAAIRVLARFPGARVSLVCPATPWDAPAAMLDMAMDCDPPAKVKAA